MVETSIEEKKVFLVVTDDKCKMQEISKTIQSHVSKTTIFEAHDVHEAFFKFRNKVPHVIICDLEVARFSCVQMISDLFKGENNNFSVIFTAELPDNELFVDQVVSGQIQFLTNYKDEKWFQQCLSKSLNRLNSEKKADYILRLLNPADQLFQEGQPADSVFLVKRGELLAWKNKDGQRVDLGKIKAGEFVGEMAHLNQEPRSATVVAVTDCELIEIPFGSLDTILFTKPSWSKALFATLSKRLKITNEKLGA